MVKLSKKSIHYYVLALTSLRRPPRGHRLFNGLGGFIANTVSWEIRGNVKKMRSGT